jgi:hypothetical protein
MLCGALNYLAHGFRYVADPWFVAGTALPDWLRVLDRRARVREDGLRLRTSEADPRVASLVAGAIRHHEDDRRFHGSAAFDETRREVAAILRAALPADAGHRPWFLAHVLVEMQLDAALVAEEPARLVQYYAALGSLDAGEVESAAREVVPDCPPGLGRLVDRFVRERFVADYAEPAALVTRLDRAVRRARQPGLPASIVAALLPATGARVQARAAELAGCAPGSAEPVARASRYPGGRIGPMRGPTRAP